jgi:hypothetical protein
MVVVVIGGANGSSAALAAGRGDPEIRAVVLGSAVLLVYGVHRRLRAVGRAR